MKHSKKSNETYYVWLKILNKVGPGKEPWFFQESNASSQMRVKRKLFYSEIMTHSQENGIDSSIITQPETIPRRLLNIQVLTENS